MSSTRFSLTNTWTDNSVRQRGQRMKCITVSMLGFLVFTTLLAYLAFGDEDSGGKPVIKVVYVIFRHGDRNPTEVYPTDPYSDPKFWPGGWGALTNEGKLQMYNLGTYLRSRYTDVLEELYSPEHLLVRSSYADRCMMSAGALLASLQPPSASEIWLPGLNWQPIPVHSVPRSLDQLIVVKKHCPRYEKELEEANQSEEVSKLESENKNLYQYLSSHSGKKISSILDVEFLYNTLEIEKAKGFQLPEWTKEVFPEPMKKIATVSLGIFTQNAIMKRLMGGPLLNDIKEKMIESSRSNLVKKPKVFLIAAHDITVVNVMRSLGIVEALKPDFGASLLFELHTGPPGFGDDFVKVFYMNSSSTTQPTPLLLPGCQELCPLSDFVSVAATLAVTPSDWENICST